MHTPKPHDLVEQTAAKAAAAALEYWRKYVHADQLQLTRDELQNYTAATARIAAHFTLQSYQHAQAHARN